MKPAHFDIGKQAIFPQNVKHSPCSRYVALTWVLSINEDIIQVYDDKDIETFGQDLIDITLKTCQCIG